VREHAAPLALREKGWRFCRGSGEPALRSLAEAARASARALTERQS
jgi:hypothetical protein